MNTGFIWGIRSRNGKESYNNLNTVNARRSRKTKGFTLVELIVVLVILAILAAIAVPTMIGFIDRAREKKIQANAEAALAATQTKLNDLYSDAANSFTPEARNDARVLAGLKEVESEFIVWTKKSLIDGNTVAKPSNLGAYTIDSALYIENGSYYFYDGSDWTKSDSDPRDTVEGSSIIHVWPYERDTAYKGPKEYDPDKPDDEQEESDIKIVTLILPDDTLDHIYYSRVGRVENSGINSVDIIFWKEEDGIHSYWDTDKQPEELKIDDYYTYFIHKDGGCSLLAWEDIENTGANLFPGKNNGSMNTVLADSRTVGTTGIQEYIFGESNKLKSTFTFKAVTDIQISAVDSVKISKPAFRGMITAPVTTMRKIPYGPGGYESESVLRNEHPNAVRIDDKEIWDGYVYAWIDGGVLYWWTNANKVYMPEDCSGFFQGNTNLQYFSFAGFDMSLVTTTKNMFAGATALQEIELSNSFNATSLVNVNGMFKNTPSLTILDEEASLQTGTLTDVTSMFAGCGLPTIELPDKMDMSQITGMVSMFDGCLATNIDLSNVNLNNTTDLTGTFANSKQLKEVVFTPSGTSVKPTTLKNTFNGCSAMTELDLSSFDTSGLKSLEGTFGGCSALSDLNVSWGNVMSIETMHGAFEGLTSLENLTLGDHWNLKNCTDMSAAFKNCSKLENVDFSKFQTSYKLTNISYMFEGCEKLSNVNLEKMNTSRVTDMYSVFKNCKKLETLNLTSFETTRVRHMDEMFAGTESLQTLDLSTFDTERTVSYTNMFKFELDNDGKAKTKLQTIYASPRFVLTDACQAGTMFTNAVALKGGRGTAYESVKENTHDEQIGKYAYIDGWNGKIGYFTERAKKTYVKKTELQRFFNGGYGRATNIVKVANNSLTIDEVKANKGAYSIKDVAKDKSANGGTETPLNVYAWMDGDTVKWWTDADLVCMFDTYEKFLQNNSTVVSFDFTGFDVSEVTNMNLMFNNATSLNSVTFGTYFYADNVNTVASMFSGCSSLSSIDIGNMNAGANKKLTLMNYMFSGCSSLSDITFERGFDSSKVTNMQNAFQNCSSLTTLNLTSMDVSSVTTMPDAFNGCSLLPTVNIDGWNLSKCTNLTSAFANCTALTGVDFSNVTTSNKLTGIKSLFDGDSNITELDLSHLDLSGVTNIKTTFKGCSSLEKLVFNGGNAGKIGDRTDLFTGCTNLKNITMQKWKFNNVNQFKGMISTCPAENIVLDYSNADIGTLTSLEQMFMGSNNLKELNLSGWGVENVTTMKKAFMNCENLSSIKGLETWNTAKLTSLHSTFEGCKALTSIEEIENWDVSKVTNLQGTFKACEGLSGFDLSNWDVSSATSMMELFCGCKSLTSLSSIENWDISKVTTLQGTFKECESLTNLDLSNWNDGSVTSIKEMFLGCKELVTLDWCGWTLKKLTNQDNVLDAFKDCSALTTVYVYSNFAPSTNIVNKSVFDGCISLKGGKGTAYSESLANYKNATYMWPDGVSGRNEGKGYFTCRFKIGYLKKLGKDWITEIGGLSATVTAFEKGTENSVPANAVNLKDTERTLPAGSTDELADVFFWMEGTKVKWYSDADVVYANADLSSMFEGWSSATNGINLSELNCEEVTNVSAMFKGCSKLTTVGITPLRSSPISNMSEMFSGCEKLTSVSFSGFDTASVTNMSGLFKNCKALATIDLSNFDTAELTDASSMFEDCSNLSSLKLGDDFACRKVTTMSAMFKNCGALTKLDLTTFDNTGSGNKLTNTTEMFSGCSKLRTIYSRDPSLEINNYMGFENKPGITSTDMFAGCTQLKGGYGTLYADDKVDGNYAYADKEGREGYFTDNSVAIKKYAHMTNFTGNTWGGRISNYSSITSFSRDTSYESESDLPIDKKDITALGSEYNVYMWVKDNKVYWWSEADVVYIGNSCMGWFQDWVNLTSADFTGLDATNVTSLESMFRNCQKLSSVTFGELFNTANVTTMKNMFSMSTDTTWTMHNYVLTELDLTPFKTTNLANVADMFTRCDNLEKVYVDPLEWEGTATGQGLTDTSSTNGNGRNMFKTCKSIKGPNGSVPNSSKISTNGEPTISSIYAMVDEKTDEDLNQNGKYGEKGYFWVKQ